MSIGQLWSKLLTERKISVEAKNITLKFRRDCSNRTGCTDIEVIVKHGKWKHTRYLIDFGECLSINQLLYAIIALFDDTKSCSHTILGEDLPSEEFYALLSASVEMEMHDIAYSKESHLKANMEYYAQIHVFKGYCDVVSCCKIRCHGTRCAEHDCS